MRVQSIAICWNRLAYNKAFITDYIKSTQFPHILLIVDNGSTDGTTTYLKLLEHAYKNNQLNTGNIKLKFRYYIKNYGPHRTENHFIRNPVDNEAEYYVRCYIDVDMSRTYCKDWLEDSIDLLDKVPKIASVAPLDRDWDQFITENGKTFIGGELFEFSEEIRVTRKSIFEEFGRPVLNIWSKTATEYFNQVRKKYITAVLPTWKIRHYQEPTCSISMEEKDINYKKHMLLSRRVYSHARPFIEATGPWLLEWEEDGKRYYDLNELMGEAWCPQEMMDKEYIEAHLEGNTKESDIELLEKDGIKVERFKSTDERYPMNK